MPRNTPVGRNKLTIRPKSNVGADGPVDQTSSLPKSATWAHRHREFAIAKFLRRTAEIRLALFNTLFMTKAMEHWGKRELTVRCSVNVFSTLCNSTSLKTLCVVQKALQRLQEWKSTAAMVCQAESRATQQDPKVCASWPHCCLTVECFSRIAKIKDPRSTLSSTLSS